MPGSRLPHPCRVGAELHAAEAATLKKITDGIGLELGLLGHGVLAVILGVPRRAIAIVVGLVVVPPGALVAGGPVEDLEAQVRVLEANADELGKILSTEPDRQPALVDGRVAHIADPETQHAQAVLVGIERAQRLAEGLADAVARIRAHRDIDANAMVAGVEPDGVVGGGEHDALHALSARCLEQIVAADDVGLQDPLPGSLDREAAQVDHPVDPIHRPLHLLDPGKLGPDELFIGAQISRLLDVAQAQLRIDRFEDLAQARADVTRGTRQQDTCHLTPPWWSLSLTSWATPGQDSA